MKKQINILIIGFGSVGKRHYQNLAKLGYTNVSVFDVDKKSISDIPRSFSDIKDVDFSEFRVVFVCSPNHMHMASAISAGKAGCHLFIEKPLAHKMREARQLSELCEKQKLVTLVGCNLRFHPCLSFIKTYLEQKRLGAVYGIHHEAGYYLPFWRKGTDYRQNYGARKATGGGIILDGIHEFDLLFWLNDFAPVKESKFLFGKSGKLDIDTEDNSIASFIFQNGVLGSVRSDYLQQRYNRNCKVVGEKGNLFWDFTENIVWFETDGKRKKLFEAKGYDINDMYRDEIAYFLRCVAQKKPTHNEVGRALTVFRYCIERK